MIFDTHAHYYYREFRDDRDELLRRLHEKDGVSAIVCVSESLETSQKSLALAQAYDFVYAAVGVHPKYAPQWRDSHYDLLRRMLSQPKVVAVGEMGLDYHRGGEDRALQEQAFVRQLELAQEAGLPVIIHDREAHGDTYRILRAYRPQGVLHCFSGSVELMREAVRLGLYIGMGGSVTFSGAVHPLEVAKAVPLHHLVLETDAPFLIPTPCRTAPNRRERSDSSMIRAVAECIAAARGMDTDELLSITEANARRLYRLA